MIAASDQKIVDSTPSTISRVIGSVLAPWKHSRIAYSGLVPMSPKTTPRHARESAQKRLSFITGVAEVMIRPSQSGLDYNRMARGSAARIQRLHRGAHLGRERGHPLHL